MDRAFYAASIPMVQLGSKFVIRDKECLDLCHGCKFYYYAII